MTLITSGTWEMRRRGKERAAWAKSRRERKGALEGNERDSREWGVTDYR